MNRVVKIVLLTALVLAVMPVVGIFAQGGTPTAQGTVISDGAGIYAEASISAEIVGSLEAGETVLIYSESGLFSEVDGGWVLTSNLAVFPK